MELRARFGAKIRAPHINNRYGTYCREASVRLQWFELDAANICIATLGGSYTSGKNEVSGIGGPKSRPAGLCWADDGPKKPRRLWPFCVIQWCFVVLRRENGNGIPTAVISKLLIIKKLTSYKTVLSTSYRATNQEVGACSMLTLVKRNFPSSRFGRSLQK